MSLSVLSSGCTFCKIIKGEAQSYRLTETAHTTSFLDIHPLTEGHVQIIPKYHAVRMHELPDKYLSDILLVAKKIAKAMGVESYDILQKNGTLAYQQVDHVHFHLVPKPAYSEGLRVSWTKKTVHNDELRRFADELRDRLYNIE